MLTSEDPTATAGTGTTADPVPDTVPDTVPARGRLVARGTVLLVVGATMLVLGLSPLLTTQARLPLVVIGAIVTHVGADRLIWGLRGRRCDLLVWMAATWLVLLAAAALLAPWLPLGESSDVSTTLAEPTYLPPMQFLDHPLGTNSFGLDMLARSIYGARASLTISLLAVSIGAVVGGVIGVLAGFYRRGADTVVGIFTNALLAVPPLILLIVLSTVLDPRVRNVAFALAVLTIPTMVRLARANTIAFSQREFVLASRAIGATRTRTMLREVVPNVLPPMMSMSVLVISGLIVAEASLSFLGLGIRAPEPTWGNMIAEVQAGETLTEHPFILLVPGAFLFLTVFSFNLLGEKAQKRWDPRSGKL